LKFSHGVLQGKIEANDEIVAVNGKLMNGVCILCVLAAKIYVHPLRLRDGL